jgi:hypothetical protein
MHNLNGQAVDDRERGPQYLVPVDHAAQAGFKRLGSQEPFDPEACRYVVGGAAGRELVEKPEALLLEGNGKNEGFDGLSHFFTPMDGRGSDPRFLPAFLHVQAQAQRAHIGPHFFDVVEALFLHPGLACVVPAERILAIGKPDGILLFVVHNYFVGSVVVHYSNLLNH